MYNEREERVDGVKIPESVDRLAAALCADYFRRERVIRAGDAPLRVRMEYEYLNRRILAAARELCEGEEDARLYRGDRRQARICEKPFHRQRKNV